MDDFGLWDVIVSIFWFTLLMTWVWLLVALLGDIFADRGLSGGAKAMWTLFLVLLPWIGALSYIFVRGDSMNERHRQREAGAVAGSSGQSTGGGANRVAEELRSLTELRDSGVLSATEYEQAKTKVLA